ncbi:hypothetical protein [uncultured Lacinutrix sp.]|uniref:hypothetical protein n=1 Tax=uncultured Lacinutrix sp. TaxID=574032 RepID=UPI002621E137|nr:hypothetical protein [uncultured Lacinutrix sp.]
MTISKKRKKRVNVEGKEYLWWVFDETDQTEFDGIQIKAVSSDQSMFLKYGLQQIENNRKIVISLRDNIKLVHIFSPTKFENKDGIITKSGVVRLINWCKRENHIIQYALDGMNNNLDEESQKLILKELQSIL